MPIEQAARVTSKVQHRNFFIREAAAVGAAIFAVRGGAKGMKKNLRIANYIKTAGGVIDEQIGLTSGDEQIIEGVKSVTLEEEKHHAANTSEKTKTDEHKVPPKTGSDSVFIENHPASRRGDLTVCKGVIVDGAPHILFGGTPVSEEERVKEQLPKELVILEAVIDAANKVANPAPRSRRDVLRTVATVKKWATKLGVW